MEHLSGIRNIIFDLGGVLLDLDFQAPVIAFQKLGVPKDAPDFRHSVFYPVFLQLEVGDISPGEFRDQMREAIGNHQIADEEIDDAWCCILGSIPANKVILLQRLASRYRLFLYSNTNVIHIEYFKERFFREHHFHFETLFEKAFYSHELHDRKPQASGYEKVLSRAGIDAGETLFVDDFVQNIEAAQKLGLKVLHYIPGTDLSGFFTILPE
jgi:glucose-1-phosphatase